MGPDPPRPARHVDQQGGRLPDARLGRHDARSGSSSCAARIGVEAGPRQTVGEQIYEVAQTQIAEQGLPSKAIGRWFPYVAILLLFIFVVNLLGFIPLPLTGETLARLPGLGHLRGDLVALGDARARAA